MWRDQEVVVHIYKRSIIFYTALSACRTFKRKDTSWGLGNKFLNVFFGGVDHAVIAPGITFSFCSFLCLFSFLVLPLTPYSTGPVDIFSSHSGWHYLDLAQPGCLSHPGDSVGRQGSQASWPAFPGITGPRVRPPGEHWGSLINQPLHSPQSSV